MRKYFGTDGVRGIANKELTPELAFKLRPDWWPCIDKRSTREVASACWTRYTYFRAICLKMRLLQVFCRLEWK